ncbi:hypothetical protein Zmor_009789 [Zophobas morio]|uniref:Uncharacterized protein n=1 Tax=Zophobas morio TaxID=2755281 RepID=A0AA38IJG9_9CUCU|nr:hypothetical protein Zmor_009789 [Zophobas morio]
MNTLLRDLYYTYSRYMRVVFVRNIKMWGRRAAHTHTCDILGACSGHSRPLLARKSKGHLHGLVDVPIYLAGRAKITFNRNTQLIGSQNYAGGTKYQLFAADVGRNALRGSR